jgi:hypothetical protein
MRVDEARDLTISRRDDIIRDLLDALKAIKTTSGYRTDPKTVVSWQIDVFKENELPAIDLFDTESVEEDNASRVTHTLEISMEYVAGTTKGYLTSDQLRLGASDILKAIGAIEDRFCTKYATDLMKFTGTTMGLDSPNKVLGGMAVKIQIKYKTPRWEL